jgi:anti-sigma B factor antagonist
MAAEGVPRPHPCHSVAEAGGYVDSTELLSVVVQPLEHAAWMIQVAGEVDMITGPLLHKHLAQLLDTWPERLVIDLSQVTFMGSTGLSVLIDARHTATHQGTTLQLTGTTRRAVAVPLEITGLDHLFEILPPNDRW